MIITSILLREHTLTHCVADVASRGNNDTLYKKWFGNGDYVAVIGAYESLLVTNKANMTLRCDNIDGK